MMLGFTETFGSPERLLGEITEDLDVEGSLLDAETVAAAFVAMTDGLPVLVPSLTSPRHIESVLVRDLVPRLGESSSPLAVPVLLALGDVADGRVRTEATKAALRMLQGGHQLPVWAADLAAPVIAHDCYRVFDTSGRVIEFGAVLERATRSWAAIATIDEQFGVVDSVECLADRSAAYVAARFDIKHRRDDRYATKESLEPAEFVRQLGAAFDPLPQPMIDPYVFRQPDDDDLLGSPEGQTMGVLMRSWLRKVADQLGPT